MKAKRFLVIALAVLSLSACGGKKTTCDFCGETKVCEAKSVLGEEVNICKDCLKELTAGN